MNPVEEWDRACTTAWFRSTVVTGFSPSGPLPLLSVPLIGEFKMNRRTSCGLAMAPPNKLRSLTKQELVQVPLPKYTLAEQSNASSGVASNEPEARSESAYFISLYLKNAYCHRLASPR